MAERRPVLGTSPEALAALLDGAGRSRRAYRLLRQGRDPFTDDREPAGARRRLADVCRPTAVEVRKTTCASDGTVKLLLGFEGGAAVETVLLAAEGRATLCVSSQVGCARGCRFCRTATMGLVRNLSCDEIVAQVVAGIREARERAVASPTNLVLMGMGEPLDNLDAVASALQIICADAGLAFAPRRVTVSTVGPSPAAVRRAARLPGHLAWSLHAADDELRRSLVPSARAPVAELRDAFGEVLAKTRAPLFVEVALIDGVNDRPEDADALHRLLDGVDAEVRINLLPMNPIDASGDGTLRPSPIAAVEAFRDRLRRAGYFCMVRRARGQDALAACGQLAV